MAARSDGPKTALDAAVSPGDIARLMAEVLTKAGSCPATDTVAMSSAPEGKNPPRLVIEQVTPVLEGGRYPIKRRVGSLITVGAAIFKDGHDLITARLRYRHQNEADFRETPLEYQYDPDRWFGKFRVDQIGRWQYTIEAWPDHYRTWRSDLDKRLQVGQDVRSELLHGADLLERRARRQPGDVGQRLTQAARKLADANVRIEERLAIAFSDEILSLAYGPIDEREALTYSPTLEIIVDDEVASFSSWYELFPRSESRDPNVHGTFADVERRLPELAALGFDVLYLPPIHPIGSTHRKGRNNARVCQPGDVGSPWAIGAAEGGHTAVHPELGTVEDFEALVRSAGDFGIEIALDYALQCSPDHPWVKEHPEWFYIRPDGSIRYAENPPKKYEDIYPLNFWCADREGLWNACKDIVLFWIERGVRIFRVDNPHTKPLAFWEWMLAEVQRAHPNTIFLAEAFTRPNRMKALAKIGFSQSYTYFTWKNTAAELKEYVSELTQTDIVDFYRPNFFANTPDILHEYLQVGGRPAFRIRLLLAGTMAPVYGIYSGYELCENKARNEGSEEYLDSEKYEIRVRDWSAPGNIKHDVSRLNRIRRENPALHVLDNLTFLHTDSDMILAYRKSAPGNELIVVVNLDPHHVHETMITVPIDSYGIADGEAYDVEDLLTGERYVWRGARNYVKLDPAERVGHILRVLGRRK
jgi:starch synthase (maltosyl-transferring)